jgi:hypothetical protein
VYLSVCRRDPYTTCSGFLSYSGSEMGDSGDGGASAYGHVEVVKALLDKGADANVMTVKGYTVLMHASVKGHVAGGKAWLARGGLISMPRLGRA